MNDDVPVRVKSLLADDRPREECGVLGISTPHGDGVGPFSQFNERARMRAEDVLPQPRGPENR